MPKEKKFEIPKSGKWRKRNPYAVITKRKSKIISAKVYLCYVHLTVVSAKTRYFDLNRKYCIMNCRYSSSSQPNHYRIQIVSSQLEIMKYIRGKSVKLSS